jgi:Ty3 transposon capsid-like protein/Zinc knuckle
MTPTKGSKKSNQNAELEVDQLELYRRESQDSALEDSCLKKEMAKAVPKFDRINQNQKKLDEFIYRLTKYFSIDNYDDNQKLCFVETKLEDVALTWYRNNAPETFVEFTETLQARFVNPDHERLNINKLNNLRYKNDAEKYVKEFCGIVELIGEQKLNDNICSFLRPLPDETRKDLYINEANLVDKESLYRALIRNKAFETETQVTARVTNARKETRKCYNCGLPGHLVRDCRQRKSNGQTKTKKRVEFGNLAENGEEKSCYMALSAYEVTTTTIVVSSCGQHMANSDYRMYDLRECVKSVTIANGSSVHLPHVGNKVCTQADSVCDLVLNKVLLVPLLKSMLLSVPAITDSGIEVTFTKDFVEFKQGTKSMAKGKCKGRIYKLALNISGTACLLSETEERHFKLGHPSPEKMSRLQTIYPGKNLKSKSDYRCEACMKGRFRRQPFKWIAREKEKQNCMVFDICGPFAEKGHDGSRYMLVMEECFSWYVKKTLLETQKATKIVQELMSFITMLENTTGETVKSVLSDNAKEFKSEVMRTTLEGRGIAKIVKGLYSLQSIRMAERFNYSILNKVLTFRISAGLPGHLWTELALCAVYVMNRRPSTHMDFLSPYQALFSKIPPINHLKVVGQKVIYALWNANKLDPRGKNGVFVNYDMDSRSYRN